MNDLPEGYSRVNVEGTHRACKGPLVGSNVRYVRDATTIYGTDGWDTFPVPTELVPWLMDGPNEVLS